MSASHRKKTTAVIVAVQVRNRYPPAADTAGPVNAERFLMQWLEEQEANEIQAVIERLWKE
ncbi:hypothetical protein [Endozoicomonas sp. 2B-B]